MSLFFKNLLLLCLFFTVTNAAKATCIGLVTVGPGHFWTEVEKGALKAGEDLGIKVYARISTGEHNTSAQERLIRETVLDNNCQGLVLSPDSDKRSQTIEELKSLGIPTVYIDRDYVADRESIIATNNYEAGKLAAIEMAKKLNGSGNIAILGLSKDLISTSERERGFIDGAAEAGINISIHEHIGPDFGDVRKKSLKILKMMKDIDGIFTPNEMSTVAVLINLQNMKRAGDMVHIGFDSHPRMVDALKTGEIYGFIIQKPFEMGYLGVKTVHNIINNKEFNIEVDTGATFITLKNTHIIQQNKQ